MLTANMLIAEDSHVHSNSGKSLLCEKENFSNKSLVTFLRGVWGRVLSFWIPNPIVNFSILKKVCVCVCVLIGMVRRDPEELIKYEQMYFKD